MNDFSNFISEVNHIYKTGVDITIIECDTNITKICKYDKKVNLNLLVVEVLMFAQL